MVWASPKVSIVGLAIATAVFLGACTDSSESTPTFEPTLTLIPATLTPVPTAPSTREPIATSIRPSDLPTYTPSDVGLLPPEASASVNRILEAVETDTDLERDARILNLKALDIPIRNGAILCEESELRPPTDQQAGFRAVVGNQAEAVVYFTTIDGLVARCDVLPLLTNDGTPLYFDPISESLVDIALRDLSNQLGLETSGITWVDLAAITWRDTSLGCPAPTSSYSFLLIDGYRIVFEAEDTLYTYHADGLEVRICPIEREVLPPPFAESAISPSEETPTIAPTP